MTKQKPQPTTPKHHQQQQQHHAKSLLTGDEAVVAADANANANADADVGAGSATASKAAKKTSTELWKDLFKEGKARQRKMETNWNIALAVLTALSFLTRVYRLNDPGQVVFDEVHFGKFASYYLRREYYFDVHPPLGKLLLALTGWFLGYDGHYLFDNIGEDYAANRVPYIGMRLFPATCGTLIVPFAFSTLKEMGVSFPAALLGGLMLVFDNALIAQSRLILLDSILLLFGVMSIYTWVRFYKERHTPFSFKWYLWLSLTGVSLALTLGVKMVGLFTIATVGIAVLFDLWRLLDINRGLSNREFTRHFAARALCLIFLPLFLYMSFFYIHFEVLNKSGSGDSFMSPAFQAGLKGSDVSANSISIPYGSKVTFFHVKEKAYLHSHDNTYPLRYEDGRVSSQGQQVTGYPFKDVNNMFQIIPADPELYPPALDYIETEDEKSKGIKFVKADHVVQIYHPTTESFLLTHDVASPLTTTNMEITTIKKSDENASTRYNETLWRIEELEGGKGFPLKSRRNHFRIINIKHNVAVLMNKGLLPEWGFGQRETNGNKNLLDKLNAWYIEDVEHPLIVNGTFIGEKQETKVEKKKEKRLSFMQKFLELQSAMFHHNAALTKPHPYSSTPISWPFNVRGISFWETKPGLRQIYLLGNPFIWWSAIGCIGLFAVLWIMDRILLRRGIDLFGSIPVRRWWDHSVGFLFIAWLMHWLPFFLMGRMLFAHHYLPSLIFSIMCGASLLDFIARVLHERNPIQSVGGDIKVAARLPFIAWMRSETNPIFWTLIVGILSMYIWCFIYFAPLTYGYGFPNVEQLRARKWLKSWDLQHA